MYELFEHTIIYFLIDIMKTTRIFWLGLIALVHRSPPWVPLLKPREADAAVVITGKVATIETAATPADLFTAQVTTVATAIKGTADKDTVTARLSLSETLPTDTATMRTTDNTTPPLKERHGWLIVGFTSLSVSVSSSAVRAVGSG